jgi:hypothetical protein
MPLETGCHAVVRVREDPVMVASLEKAGLEMPALVGLICWGQPKRTTQRETKALAIDTAVMSDSVSVSGQRVYLSMAVRQYGKPDERGRGPTSSICT